MKRQGFIRPEGLPGPGISLAIHNDVMLLPSINIVPGTSDTEKKGPSSGEKGVDSATAFSVFLPFFMSTISTPNPENALGGRNSAESGGIALTPDTTGQQQTGIREKQSPVLSDIIKAALGADATQGRENSQDKTGVTDTPNPANIIGKAGNKAQETSAETTTEDGKATTTTSLPTQKELPGTNASNAIYKLKPANPEEPALINNTTGRQRTPPKTEVEVPGKNNATPGKAASVNPMLNGKTPEDASGLEPGLHQNRKDTDISSRTENRPNNENSFLFQKIDIPETESQHLNRNSSPHKTGETILSEKLPETSGTQINKATPTHKNPSIELTIEPEGLGKIDIEVSVHDGEVRAELGVEKLKSLMDLQNNMPQLFDSLAKVGLTPGGFSLFLKNRGNKKWMKAQYNQKTIKDIAINPQKSNHGNQSLYTVSIRV
ncbi:MAG: flagellar hook-length control protein FliK [Nitrospirota bacterium]|nr:flagellar hook-length control protein FliK [Nitrospirota bacterium]